jgi:hypothetical protein
MAYKETSQAERQGNAEAVRARSAGTGTEYCRGLLETKCDWMRRRQAAKRTSTPARHVRGRR